MNLHTLTENFYNMEKDLDLFSKSIHGVFFWKIIRFNIFMHLARELNIYDQAHLSLKQNKFQTKLSNYRKIYNTERHSYISRKNPVDILVFEHPRKVKIDRSYKDIYTYKKVEQLEKDNLSYEVVDAPYLDKHYDKPSKKRSYFEDYGFKYINLRKISNITLSDSDKEIIESVENKIENIFGVKRQLETYIVSAVRGFTLRKKIIKEALSKREVKKVYLVVSYGHESLISACKELEIECIEIQHGTMSYYHPGYSFPYNKSVPYFPDKIEMFGEYWLDSTPLPIASENISFIGYPYLNEQLKKYSHIEKTPNQVLFLSQGAIGEKLSNYAYEFAKKNSEFKIIYKLHPGEFGRWRGEYKMLLKAQDLKNFKILEDEKNLYELLAGSSYAFGVFSTAIYEALEVGCRVFLIDLSGVEYSEYLYKNQIVDRIKTDIIFDLKLAKNDRKNYKDGYFFRSKARIH